MTDHTQLTADGKALIINDGVITLKGLDTATAGQSFKLNDTADGLVWFKSVSADEMATELAKKVDNAYANADGTVTSNLTNGTTGITATATNADKVTATVAVVNDATEEIKVSVVDVPDANKGARLIIRKGGVYYTSGQSNDAFVAGNELATKADLEGAMHFKGSVPTADDLPTNAENGDIYQVVDTNKMVIWNGTEWDDFHAVSLEGYVTEDELGTTLADYATIAALEAGEIDVKIPEATADKAGLLSTDGFKQLAVLKDRGAMNGIKLGTPVVPNVVVSYFDHEMRLMFPADTAWVVNREGKYFAPIMVYAPAEAKYFKESLALDITDETWYEFENNDFAGIDENGNKYSLVWFPIAQEEEGGTWTYFGSKSTPTKFVGWFYHGDWYDENKNLIGTSIYRINLTNEALMNVAVPYFVAQGVTMDMVNTAITTALDNMTVSTDKLVNGTKVLVIDGGTPIVADAGNGG